MRCFVAVVPPPEALDDLAAHVDAARARWPRLGWVRRDRWHLTLAFLGEVSDRDVERLQPQLAAVAASAAPFELAVSGAGTFGGSKPRVLWAGLDGDVPALDALAADVARAAKRARVRLDRKPFRAHLTLARARRDPVDDQPALVATVDVRGPRFAVRELVLFRSHLGADPKYDVLGSWELAHQA